MGKALYRKYRSKSLSEVVGQEHITKTLQHAIQSGRISHAYLFTGPRGTGKTSVARILAHELNNVPYTDESPHLDILEIDAASSGGVDEVRDLREKVYIAPAHGKYKVYIIDEVHMMTTAAFNALLKTLEEPPAHAVFILATTEAHKLPATIVSRTQRFTFKPIPSDQVTAHLRFIADQEKIDISDEALELLAAHGGGSFRDSISMLDQVRGLHTHLKRKHIEQLLGIPPQTATEGLLKALTNHDAVALIAGLDSLRLSGYQAGTITKQLAQALRTNLLEGNTSLTNTVILHILGQLIDVPAATNPEQLLEIILLEAIFGDPTPTTPPTPAAKPVTSTRISKTDSPENSQPAIKTKTAALTVSDQANLSMPAERPRKSPEQAATITDAQWQAVLDALKKQYNTLYGVIRTAEAHFTSGKVQLTFKFAFHQKRANDSRNKNILTNVLQTVTGHTIELECLLAPKVQKATNPQTEPTPESTSTVAADSPLKTINHIFGGGELLEST